MAKQQVELISNHGTKKMHDFDHAERLLVAMSKSKAPTWSLVEADKYEIVDGKLITNRSVKGSKKSDRKQSGNEGEAKLPQKEE